MTNEPGAELILWDIGTWTPHQKDVDAALKKSKLSFELDGERLHGNWALVRLGARARSDRDNWLLIKEKDDFARRGGVAAVDRETTSVASGRTLEDIAGDGKVWRSSRPGAGSHSGSIEIVGGLTPARKVRVPSRQSHGRRGGGRNTGLPSFVAPQLATLVDAPPAGDAWLHEIKYDSYRVIASLAGDKVVLRTRTGLDWTDRFRALVPALQRLRCASAVLDGEAAVADAHGKTDFGALQDALSDGKGCIAYYLFDILHLDGRDLRNTPLIERKEILKHLLARSAPGGPLIYSDHVQGKGEDVFKNACNLHLEGIVSKRANVPYRSGRSGDWLKSKCRLEQEFVIVGWRPSAKTGRPFSPILLGVRERGRLRYAGRVGTGYSERQLENLAAEFRKRIRKSPPVDDVPPPIARQVRFVEPDLVAEIAFRGWTRDGLVR